MTRLSRRLVAALVLLLLLAGAASAAAAGTLSLAPADRLLVVAPHPDDETLGAGGLIQTAVEAHVPVKVIVVTNGDGSTPAAQRLSKNFVILPADRIRLGRARQAETRAALSALGLAPEAVEFLGYPDRPLSQLWEDAWTTPYYSTILRRDHIVYESVRTPGAPFSGASLRHDLSSVIEEFRPTVVVIPSTLDTHPDHRATALFAQHALLDHPELRPRMYAYLIHRGPWPPRGPSLTAPSSVMASRLEWYSLTLRPDLVARKAEAVKRYKTQVMGNGANLLQYARPNELFSEVRIARLSRSEAVVSSETEARAGFREVGGPKGRLLKVRRPGTWSLLARGEDGYLHVRLVADAAQLAPTEYVFLVRDGERFTKVVTKQSHAVIPVSGREFFLTAQLSDARGGIMTLPWVACDWLFPLLHTAFSHQ